MPREWKEEDLGVFIFRSGLAESFGLEKSDEELIAILSAEENVKEATILTDGMVRVELKEPVQHQALYDFKRTLLEKGVRFEENKRHYPLGQNLNEPC